MSSSLWIEGRVLGARPSGALRVSVVDRRGVERIALLPATHLRAPPQPLGVHGLSSLLVCAAWAQERLVPGAHEGACLQRRIAPEEVAALQARAVRGPVVNLPPLPTIRRPDPE